jgi:adenine nucleotide transporter 17
MAKVRIQARSSNASSALEQHLPVHAKQQSQSDGAIDILARAWREEGPLGWYQVCFRMYTAAVTCSNRRR